MECREGGIEEIEISRCIFAFCVASYKFCTDVGYAERSEARASRRKMLPASGRTPKCQHKLTPCFFSTAATCAKNLAGTQWGRHQGCGQAGGREIGVAMGADSGGCCSRLR